MRRFFSLLLRALFQIFVQRLRELIGTGRVVAAFDSAQKRPYFVDGPALDELCNALQVSAASADEFYVADFVLLVYVENDLTGASSFCGICVHKYLTEISLQDFRKWQYRDRLPCPPIFCKCFARFYDQE